MAALRPSLSLLTNGIPGWRRFPPNLFAIPTVITAFIGYIAVRTMVLITRGQLLPPRAVPERGGSEVQPNERVVPAAP
jgi:hypothetical protein